MRFEYQKTNRYFAQVPSGVEEPAYRELAALGAEKISPAFKGLYFSASAESLMRICYASRLITRVLAPLVCFACRSRDDIYQAGKRIDWRRMLSVHDRFAIFANAANNDQIRHSQFAALCLKDAVVDAFRDRTGRRPDVDRLDPDVWFNLHIEGEKATISLDVSGGPMHKRGYRKKTVEAPMQEILAAAVVALSGWQGDTPLCDPMCGSGTLLCEAVMDFCRIPSGFLKTRFGFQRLPDFNPELWDRVRKASDAAIRPLPQRLIMGSDLSWPAVRAAQVNCSTLPAGVNVQISKKDFMDIPALENQTILCNPPYGVRRDGGENLGVLDQQPGHFLKHRCRGSRAVIFFGNREMLKWIGLKPTWKKPIKNAGLDGRLAAFEMY